MEYINIPETVKIGGKEAIRSLNDYINELEQQTSNQLTKKQKSAMIKFARGLISSIEYEMQHKTARKPARKVSVMKQIKQAILKGCLEFGSASDNNVKPAGAKPTIEPNLKLGKDADK